MFTRQCICGNTMLLFNDHEMNSFMRGQLAIIRSVQETDRKITIDMQWSDIKAKHQN